jgi:hypothetical protein
VHNHPERLKLLPGCQHLKIELPGVTGAVQHGGSTTAGFWGRMAGRLLTTNLVSCLSRPCTDTETADISSHFNACFEFMAEAERLRQGGSTGLRHGICLGHSLVSCGSV